MMPKDPAGFRLPEAQVDKTGWWNAPPCLSGLRWWYFIPKCKFQGTRDILEVRKEQTVALAKALLHCAEWSGVPPGTMCGAVWDLQRCLVPLMQLEEEDIWEDSLLSLWGRAHGFPNPHRGGPTAWWGPGAPGSTGICPTYSCLAKRDPHTWSQSQSSGSPWIFSDNYHCCHQGQTATTPGRCRTLGSTPQRSPVGYTLPGFLGDGHS